MCYIDVKNKSKFEAKYSNFIIYFVLALWYYSDTIYLILWLCFKNVKNVKNLFLKILDYD